MALINLINDTTYKSDESGFNLGTDNRAALQNAINTIPDSGGVIEIPPGIFYLSGGVNWICKPGVFKGSGVDTTIFVCDQNFLFVQNTQKSSIENSSIWGHFLIEDMTILSTKSLLNTTEGYTALNIIGSFNNPEAKQSVTISRCSFGGTDFRLQPTKITKEDGVEYKQFKTQCGWKTAIWLRASTSTIRNCSIVGPRGVRQKGGGSGGIEGSDGPGIEQGMLHAVHITAGTDFKIVDNFIADCQYGVLIAPEKGQSEASTIANTQFINTDYAVRIKVKNKISSFHTVKNCYMGTLVGGISISGEYYPDASALLSFIESNVIWTYDGFGRGPNDKIGQVRSGWFGIKIDGRHNVITNNIITGIDSRKRTMKGIVLTETTSKSSSNDSSFNIITNNNIFACDNSIVYSKTAKKNLVYGNQFGGTSSDILAIPQALNIEPYNGPVAPSQNQTIGAGVCTINANSNLGVILGTASPAISDVNIINNTENINLITNKVTVPLIIKPYVCSNPPVENRPTIILEGNLKLVPSRSLPLSSSSTPGTPGEMMFGSITNQGKTTSYLYHCNSAGKWQRVQLSDF